MKRMLVSEEESRRRVLHDTLILSQSEKTLTVGGGEGRDSSGLQDLVGGGSLINTKIIYS